jgi:hypothetical protein
VDFSLNCYQHNDTAEEHSRININKTFWHVIYYFKSFAAGKPCQVERRVGISRSQMLNIYKRTSLFVESGNRTKKFFCVGRRKTATEGWTGWYDKAAFTRPIWQCVIAVRCVFAMHFYLFVLTHTPINTLG